MSRAALTVWSERLLGSLAASGVREVVISPGSRSTPFVAAALALQDAGALRCHTVIDERAAGFFALGMSRSSESPALLLCTSGSAGAHYLPAVIEAGRSGIPLLVLTADRPLELMDCGASQTIDQTRLFGEHAVGFVELGAPEAEVGALRALGRRLAQAVATTRWPRPGAVQLNARARKPLEPAVPGDPELVALQAQLGRLPPPPRFLVPQLAPDPAGLDEVAGRLQRAERSLIVCGPNPLAAAGLREAVLELARRSGSPLLVEATSQLRFGEVAGPGDDPRVDGFDALLRSPRARTELAPDLVVQLGAAPTSAAWEAFLEAHPACPRVLLSPRLDCDAQNAATLVLLGDLQATVEGLRARLAGTPDGGSAGRDWVSRWGSANRAAWRAVDGLLAEQGPRSEGLAVRTAALALGTGALLMVGNSLPVREVDTFVPARAVGCRVLSQRGASGIDGLIAGAAGAARVAGPTTLLVGDVSFLHDAGGLAAAREVPLTVVVLNNGGGRIFEQLPVARAASTGAALEHWTTPHRLDLSFAAALHGQRFLRVEGPAALREAMASAQVGPGCTVIEVVLDPASATDFYARLPERIGVELDQGRGEKLRFERGNDP